MTSYQMTNDKKLGIDNIYLDKDWKMLDIVNTAKTVSGSERLDMVTYFYWIWENNIRNESKSWMYFKEEYIIYIWHKFQLDTSMFSTHIRLTKFGTGF